MIKKILFLFCILSPIIHASQSRVQQPHAAVSATVFEACRFITDLEEQNLSSKELLKINDLNGKITKLAVCALSKTQTNGLIFNTLAPEVIELLKSINTHPSFLTERHKQCLEQYLSDLQKTSNAQDLSTKFSLLFSKISKVF